jgi:hypothetical protein
MSIRKRDAPIITANATSLRLGSNAVGGGFHVINVTLCSLDTQHRFGRNKNSMNVEFCAETAASN